ncbi:MAG: 1-acyl-sn-glycerol-3-phosphate acyltransferase [Bacteroidales bacterium]|nr:1-acyl-sn-glycerol-3-phosphate acyltransferase [Bacteroidales bacterium]
MNKPFERFDMARDPVRTKWYLKPLTKILSWSDMIVHKPAIHFHGVDKPIKPPYLMLCNHNAFMDFKVATQVIYPHSANYVVAIDGFIGREWLLRAVGCICKRKFTNDTVLIRQLSKVIRNGDIAVVYPEARYSLCGTTAVLPSSLGKLCKLLKVPIVTLVTHGHHANSPFWNLHDRKIHTEADYTLLLTPEQVETLTVDEINKKIVDAFQYDDFAWQKETGTRVKYAGRAEGLHKVLYQCPHCGAEYEMDSSGSEIFCRHCGKRWRLGELMEISALEGETEFSHIPDWYEWERANVRKEVESGTYDSGVLPVHVDSLPNAKKFIRLGNGTLQHNMTGFHVHGTDVDGDPFEMELPIPSLYSVHIEYEYLGKYGDCVDLNTLQDTWYTYPEAPAKFSVTKMALATEELYYAYRRSIGKPCPEGLA